ncbi:MAG: permease [Candidatus Aminicenantes bacterium]|nr:permease [Candidatus Aminicenantes bacterium]
MKELKIFILLAAAFLICYFFPLSIIPFKGPIFEALALVRWYAREHVLLCLVPAFFIAGAISMFLSQASVIKYFGPNSNKVLSYGVASVSGTILAVCSCTVLPLFSGIYKRGAGLGPAIAFLYSGPAINVLAIILTARILGMEMGIARAVGAVVFSVIVGLLMHLIFLKEEKQRIAEGELHFGEEEEHRPLWKTALFFAALVGILVFANWGKPQAVDIGFWTLVFRCKWWIAGAFVALLLLMIIRWFKKEELSDWTLSSWGFAKQILPLLLLGVLASGFLLGRPGFEGLIPSSAIEKLVGGNSLFANFFASIVAAFMYFATLTEVPILQGLIGAGMGKGPALALLLAGPALSLPSMLVMRGIMGTKKTVVYVSLVVIMATISGIIYGALF